MYTCYVQKFICDISGIYTSLYITYALQVLDCFVGHLFGEKKLACALQLSYLCGGLSHDMVCTVRDKIFLLLFHALYCEMTKK